VDNDKARQGQAGMAHKDCKFPLEGMGNSPDLAECTCPAKIPRVSPNNHKTLAAVHLQGQNSKSSGIEVKPLILARAATKKQLSRKFSLFHGLLLPLWFFHPQRSR